MLVVVSSLGRVLLVLPPHPPSSVYTLGASVGLTAGLTDGSEAQAVRRPQNSLPGPRSAPSFPFPLPVCLNDPVSPPHVILPYFSLHPGFT